MVRRLWAALSLVAMIAVLGLAAGCVDSSEEEAQTPSNAPTVANSAAQTDSEGKTVSAPSGGGATAPAEGGGATTEAGGEGGGAAAGDAADGEEFFASTCTTCHLNNGTEAGGVGPQLAGAGLNEQTIRTTVENGRGAMPAGLASGEDLDNVVAYVLSIQ